jgi:hypothetical protein
MSKPKELKVAVYIPAPLVVIVDRIRNAAAAKNGGVARSRNQMVADAVAEWVKTKGGLPK